MNHMHITPLESSSAPLPDWKPEQPNDDVLPLYTDIDDVKHLEGDASARRKWFSDQSKRKQVTFTPKDALNLDFCNGILDFNTFSAKVRRSMACPALSSSSKVAEEIAMTDSWWSLLLVAEILGRTGELCQMPKV